ncbi:MAG: ATP-binding protein, partial [Desulfofundulus sp.]
PLGQVYRSRQPLVQENIPPDSVYTVQTMAGEILPVAVVYLPLVFDEDLLGVLVLGSLHPLRQSALEELQTACDVLAVAVNNALNFERVSALSQELSQLNEELAAQNEELYMQAEELQAQAEEIEAQSRELAVKNRQLEEASRMKSTFLARMSHELRTPLNAIIGFSELLMEELSGPLNEKQKEYMGDILTSARHLLNLINDILDLSRIEAGHLELRPVPVDPASILQEALTLVEPGVRVKEHTLRVELVPGRYLVQADPERLKQILVNLLSNAVKFTPARGTIEVRAVSGGEELIIEVADNGIGIAPEMHQTIFEEFCQGEVAPVHRYEGTGLGLAITRRLVEMHGGRIWVNSAPGEGATFSFTLPLVRNAIAHPVADKAASEIS